jgi:hypothetical protein
MLNPSFISPEVLLMQLHTEQGDDAATPLEIATHMETCLEAAIATFVSTAEGLGYTGPMAATVRRMFKSGDQPHLNSAPVMTLVD